ncbi:two-component system histidine kinase PnpS [Thermoanaerobacterium sp. DL9XJH110]|uniref:two-component system histidine kinase PnpS n=1 Tax=Thermoanaerobacterium sp. DL9XJH110 TaxID=3386643 RepID=UPI003BB74B43
MFRSIQWKLVSIYILLILLAMEIVGVYLLQSLEKYQVGSLARNMDTKAQLIAGFTERYLYPIPRYHEIDDKLIKELGGAEVSSIIILDESANIIFSTDEKFQRGLKLLTPEITQATFGTEARDIREEPKNSERFMYLAYPVTINGRVVGIIYLISSMKDIYSTLNDIKAILLVATLMALGIAGFLGYALSKTITGPIQEVTRQAALMAQGDFDRRIQVKSNDEIGKLTEMFNYLTTRLKETMEEISDEKEKMEAILANMADGVIALNDKSEVIHINPAAMNMLSLDRSPEGSDFSESLRKYFDVAIEDFLGEESDLRETLIKTDSLILKAIIAPLKRGSRVIGLILVLHDVTRQQRLEDMRKEFVANVSHELRTPLTTIKSYTETLLDGAMEDPEVARQFMGVVNNEADRMTRLVNDLLELSRLDNKEIRWDRRPVALNRVLLDVIAKMKVNATKKRQSLNVDIPETPCEVIADRDKIEQVFQNILSNAIKYTPEGGNISVKLELLERDVRIVFGDTGIGIPREDLPRIFERFYRVDKTRSRELGGTGLGLSIAREIVEAHGGRINIESELGKGTIVSVYLPSNSPAGRDLS